MNSFSQLLVLTLLFSAFLHEPVHAEGILFEAEFANKMVRRGVPVMVIFNARQAPTRENIRALILAIAPHHPLGQILDLYPEASTGTRTKSGEKTVLRGEVGFFDECAHDPSLFADFFGALTRGYTSINPLSFRKSPLINLSDSLVHTYIPFRVRGQSTRRTTHMLRDVYFAQYQGDLQLSPNFCYLTRLLETKPAALPSTRKIAEVRKQKPKADKIKWINLMAPLFRGEISLKEERDPAKALPFFQQAAKAHEAFQGNYREVADLISLHLAEIRLGAFDGHTFIHPEIPDEIAGISHLRNISSKSIYKIHRDLRMGQYHLGLFGHTISKDKALRILEETARNPKVSHLVYLSLADYYLGTSDPEARDIKLAQEQLDLAFKASDGIPDLEGAVHLRRAEITMGLFGTGEGEGEGSEDPDSDNSVVNIPHAMGLLERVGGIESYQHLYQIYTGHYGPAYADQGKAKQHWNLIKQLPNGEAFCAIRQAAWDYQEGKITEAFEVFVRNPRNLMCAYYMGCIQSNPHHSHYFDRRAALKHLALGAQYNFRDSLLRYRKLSSQLEAEERNKAEQRAKEEAALAEKEVVEEVAEEREITGLVAVPAVPPLEEEEDEYLTKAAQTIDETAPVRTLADPQLQDMYDNLGSSVRWKKLLKIVSAFGGVIDLQKQTMKFPRIEGVFNFHRPHSGNPMLSLHHYWAKLKAMIDQVYGMKCEEKA